MLQKIHSQIIEYLCVWVLNLLSITAATAQHLPSISVAVDKKDITIGDPINLQITIDSLPNGSVIVFPDWIKVFNQQIELISIGDIDTQKANQFYGLNQTLSVSAYADEGVYYIPSFDITYKYQQTAIAIATDSVPINLAVVAVDTTQPFKDIKDIIPIEHVQKSVAYYALLIGLILFLIAGWYYFFSKTQFAITKPSTEAAPDMVFNSLHDKYLYALNELQKKEYISKAEFKSFYSELAAILRAYISERFGIPAMELTTQELLKHTKHRPVIKKHRPNMKEVLQTADLVKFAKGNVDKENASHHFQLVKEIVQATRLREETNRNV